MTLDERLDAARAEYREAARHMHTLTVSSLNVFTGHKRRVRRVWVGIATTVAMVVASVAWSATRFDGHRSVRVIGAPTTTTSEENRPIAIYDPAIKLTPAGPYRDGQQITVSVPNGFVRDWLNESRPHVCAVVDGSTFPETCDPFGPTRTVAGAEAQVVHLDRTIFTPSGDRDCGDPAVLCHLVMMRADGKQRASLRLAFEGPSRKHSASLSITRGASPGTFLVDPSGLTTDPSWLALRSTDPTKLGDTRAFDVSLCAFRAERPTGPQHRYPWGTYGGVPFGSNNCSALDAPTVPIDPDNPNKQINVSVRREFYGYSGWSDCASDACYLAVRRTLIEDAHLNNGGIGVQVQDVITALLTFDPHTPIPPRPAITIREPGPYRARQRITVETSNFPRTFETTVGICRVDSPWQCGYDFSTSGTGNHAATLVLPDSVASCGLDQCYLEISSRSEGLPPPAVIDLPIKN